MRTPALQSALVGFLLLTPAAQATGTSTPEITLPGSCPGGAIVTLANHPPKVPVLLDRSAEREMAYWNEIKASGDPSLFLVYISNFRGGMFLSAAVEKYKSTCGDLSALPVEVLSCSSKVSPKPLLPLKRIRVRFLPPPPPKEPVIEIDPPVINLPPPPKPKIVLCGGKAIAVGMKCIKPPPPDPNDGRSGHNPGSEGNTPPPSRQSPPSPSIRGNKG